jgi:hypothetical protein
MKGGGSFKKHKIPWAKLVAYTLLGAKFYTCERKENLFAFKRSSFASMHGARKLKRM